MNQNNYIFEKTNYGKKIIIIVLLINCSLFNHIYAQVPWLQIGSKWYYEELYFMSNDTGFSIYEVVGDSIINNIHCSVIETKPGFWYLPCNVNKTYTYLSNDTVYVFDFYNNKFQSAFFFGAQVGDTLLTTLNYCDFQYRVDSIQIMSVFGSPKKCFYIRQLDNWIQYRVLEEIGGLDLGLFISDGFFCSTLTYDGATVNRLRCFVDSLGNQWSTNIASNCLYSTLNVNESLINSNYIYPNPTKNVIKIYSDKKITDISLYNIFGKIIFSQNHINSLEWETNILENMSSGCYFLKYHTETNMFLSKIIKIE